MRLSRPNAARCPQSASSRVVRFSRPIRKKPDCPLFRKRPVFPVIAAIRSPRPARTLRSRPLFRVQSVQSWLDTKALSAVHAWLDTPALLSTQGRTPSSPSFFRVQLVQSVQSWLDTRAPAVQSCLDTISFLSTLDWTPKGFLSTHGRTDWTDWTRKKDGGRSVQSGGRRFSGRRKKVFRFLSIFISESPFEMRYLIGDACDPPPPRPWPGHPASGQSPPLSALASPKTIFSVFPATLFDEEGRVCRMR
jgi:hypothetical protein